jgi:hypothetical protein
MGKHLAVGESVGPLPVHSASYYNPTGVVLDRGATYEIAADETRWLDWHLASSADGREQPSLAQLMVQWALRCKAGRWFQLIGAVGRSDDYLFPIGMHVRWTYAGQADDPAPELHLLANDAWFAYFNNHGSVNVTITRMV